MKKILLPESDGKIKYYRANLHCHSNISDGHKTPEQLKADYKAHGYDVLCITDHDILISHNDITDDEFLMLNGYEIEVNGPDSKTCHLCLVALEPDNDIQVCYHRTEYMSGNQQKNRYRIKYDETKPDFVREYTAECINEIIRTGVENGFFVTYNHPTWSLESYPEYMRYEGMNAMEIASFASFVAGYDDDNGHCYDDLLRGGKRLFCTATDDNHNRVSDDFPECGSYGGYIMIASPSLKYTDITTALKNGQFYSSTGSYLRKGPEILSLSVEDDKVFIKTSDARSIALIPDNRDNRCRNALDGETINEAEFTLGKNVKWFRIVVADNNGYKAYSNAYFTDELK